MEIHVVSPGETLQTIADTYGVSVSRLAYDNEIMGDRLVVGQALLVLRPNQVYVIQEGDTLQSIADMYNTSVLQLVRNNSYLLNDDFLFPGQSIIISYEDEDNRLINIFGYAYPFIKEGLLQENCLYIDELLPFSYGFQTDGSLILLNDGRLIQTALDIGNRVRMVLTPLDQYERFNNQLVVLLLSNQELQNVVIDNVLAIMAEKGYTALDIDFEFIPGEYRTEYVSFVATVRERLGGLGYLVSVAVPPKTSDEQRGLLYEGIDYRGLGEAADLVFLMTYEWGYKYGPPLAVAPIPSVRKVLDYAVSVIPRNKIAMGIPNYAYDWPLPYMRDITVAETIGNTQAVGIAYANNARIEYDENAQAPFFYYNSNGVDHVVWFEDIRSIVAKYSLVQEYGFTSVGYWNLMREFRQNNLYINQITG